MITYEVVASNLDSAIENGYTGILEWPTIDIAFDLIALAEDCEDCTVEELIPHIEKWLEGKKIWP